jgi:uncharacterized membrane protein YraQ (UPF0718 family)
MAASPKRKLFDTSTFVVLALALVGVAVVFAREGLAGVGHVLLEDVWLYLEILPKVLAGCLIGALVTILLPREVVTRWVGGDSGLRGLLIATLIGAVLPGGPFTIYPLAATFFLIGAGVGPVIAFVTSWTLLGFNRAIVWEIPFFGVDFVLWRMLASLPLPILAGFLGSLFARFIGGLRP